MRNILYILIFKNFTLNSSLSKLFVSLHVQKITDMGTYINKGNDAFHDIRNDEYIDKSAMIAVINSTLNTERRFSCVTRCRRFGKSMAAEMLCAYYDKSCDSRKLFNGLSIAKDTSFEKHLNKYSLIYIDITDFTTKFKNDKNIVRLLQRAIMDELLFEYPDINESDNNDLMDILVKIYNEEKQKFIIIIDEWDAIMREFGNSMETTDAYVNLLRRLFKGSESKKIFAGAYITGILPIKKYNTQSALNNFEEYSVIDPADLAGFFGFTKDEVKKVADRFGADIEQLKNWYDGYKIGHEDSIYNPYSVMKAARRHNYKSYWTNTSAYDKVTTYIQMNYEGLKDDIINMLAGGRCSVNTTKFENDLREIKSKDDVLTVLIHLGYLSYDCDDGKCYIPNKEVSMEFTNAVEDTSWTEIVKTINKSENLLEATLRGDTEAVVRGIDQAHDENTSILSYNDENSLSCVISMAYIFARNNYIIHREYATGKGFADLVLIPRKNFNSPALVIELKFNKAVNTAIDQIKQKQYPAKLAEYSGEIMLVGISYDKEKKAHECVIETL